MDDVTYIRFAAHGSVIGPKQQSPHQTDCLTLSDFPEFGWSMLGQNAKCLYTSMLVLGWLWQRQPAKGHTNRTDGTCCVYRRLLHFLLFFFSSLKFGQNQKDHVDINVNYAIALHFHLASKLLDGAHIAND